MQIPITPAQYVELQSRLEAVSGVKLTATSMDIGTIETSDVVLAYIYDGVATLTVAIRKRKSLMAHVASDATIFSKVQTLITGALATEDSQ